jgi:Family of unknown function (DUF6064)
MLPFTHDQFLTVFATYNEAIWPAQVGAYLLGCAALIFLCWRTTHGDRIITGIVAAMWLWTGLVYHGFFFSAINKAAYLFGTLFVMQGASLLYSGVYYHSLRFGLRSGPAAWIGAVFVMYAAIVYPLIGISAGHAYSELPVFGVTPCPVTIFSFGMFLLTTRPLSSWLLVIPFIWSLIGGSAAILLNVPQDWLLLVSGFIAVPILIVRDRTFQAGATRHY